MYADNRRQFLHEDKKAFSSGLFIPRSGESSAVVHVALQLVCVRLRLSAVNKSFLFSP